MIKPKSLLFLLILFAFLSISCRLVSEMVGFKQDGETQPTPVIGMADTPVPFTPEAGVELTRESELPEDTQASATQEVPTPVGEIPLEGGYPPQTTAAGIQPQARRAELTILSNLVGFQAIDYFGAPMGVVVDYVVNTCETYIIYFLVDPVESLKPGEGRFVVLPFEAITINNGVLDASLQTIRVHMAAQMSGAPAFPEGMPLTPTDWEEGVRNYWSQYFRLSGLKTECLVTQPGSGGDTMAVYKVAYATHLIGAPFQDGLGNPLGGVFDAVLEPESGKLGFFVVQLQDGDLVLVHLSAVNIPEWALEPGGQTTLVLLKENNVLANAPRIQDIEEAADAAVQQTAREYWTR